MRNAEQSGQWPESLTCPPQDTLFDLPVTVRNLTGVPISTRSGDIDCYDWSGDRTPPTVLNFPQIGPGESMTGVLRARYNTDNNWRMRFYTVGKRAGQAGGGELIGEMRVQRPKRYNSTFLLTAPANGGSLDACESVVLGPAPAGAQELAKPERPRNATEILLYVKDRRFKAFVEKPGCWRYQDMG